jgi:hypothetical protein
MEEQATGSLRWYLHVDGVREPYMWEGADLRNKNEHIQNVSVFGNNLFFVTTDGRLVNANYVRTIAPIV